MKPTNYNEIPMLDQLGPINIPGIYCKNCGETFALYSYSMMPMDGVDENNKPIYNKCFICSP